MGRIAGELSDNFLEDVLERDDALDIAVFVNDECDALAAALKLHQLHTEWCSFRNEIRLLEQSFQCVFIKRVLCQVREPAQVKDSDDLVDAVFVHGQTRVLACRDNVLDDVDIVIQIDTDDLVVRHHDVVHRDLFKVENADEHLPIASRDPAACFMDDRPQFLMAQGVQWYAVVTDAEQVQHAVGCHVDQPDERVGDFRQRVVNDRRWKREPFRMQGGKRFRRGLRKYQHNQRQDQRA